MSDDKPEPKPSPLEDLAAAARERLAKAEEEAKVRAATAAAEAAVAGAARAVAKAADGVLDGIEGMLFGKVGGAKEHLQQQEADPLTRLRSQYTKEKDAPKAAPPKEDPVAKARAELEALKAARGTRSEGAPKADGTPGTDRVVKKTL
mgnify:CR=1 FL=1|jgi:hypothetical protein